MEKTFREEVWKWTSDLLGFAGSVTGVGTRADRVVYIAASLLVFMLLVYFGVIVKIYPPKEKKDA